MIKISFLNICIIRMTSKFIVYIVYIYTNIWELVSQLHQLLFNLSVWRIWRKWTPVWYLSVTTGCCIDRGCAVRGRWHTRKSKGLVRVKERLSPPAATPTVGSLFMASVRRRRDVLPILPSSFAILNSLYFRKDTFFSPKNQKTQSVNFQKD